MNNDILYAIGYLNTNIKIKVRLDGKFSNEVWTGPSIRKINSLSPLLFTLCYAQNKSNVERPKGSLVKLLL